MEEGEDFTQAESQLILNAVLFALISLEPVHKLNGCYMQQYLDVLPRNLRALLK
jgi:hypothetical protein